MEARRPVLREVSIAFAIATAACAVLFAARNLHPLLNSQLHALVAIVFWLLPLKMLDRAGRDAAQYGLRARPVGRNLLWALGAIVVVFPLFLLGFRLYWGVLCGMSWRPAMCAHFAPQLWRHGIHVMPGFWKGALAQLVVIAIPEEFFFRGYIQGRLRDAFSPAAAIAMSSILFGLGHYFVTPLEPARLAVAFPGVIFGILREKTGSIAPGALFHASCNLYIDALHRTFFT